MLEIDRSKFIFKIKHIWFSDYPFDVKGYHSITFRACKNKINSQDFTRKEFHTLVIDLTQNLDTIWKNMSKKSCRYMINKAIKEGIEVKISQDYSHFSEINRQFRKEKGLQQDRQVELDKEYGTLFIAEIDGELLGGQFYLENENNIRWLIGASKRLEVDKEKATLIGQANRLLVWEAIKYAKDKGIREFDFGGYYINDSGDEQMRKINFFKKSFGGELVTHYIYQRDYSTIYKIAKKLYQLKYSG